MKSNNYRRSRIIIHTEKQRVDKSGFLNSELSFYNVKGRRLLLDYSGAGSPTVVFIPVAGMIGLDYLNLHPIYSSDIH